MGGPIEYIIIWRHLAQSVRGRTAVLLFPFLRLSLGLREEKLLDDQGAFGGVEVFPLAVQGSDMVSCRRFIAFKRNNDDRFLQRGRDSYTAPIQHLPIK